MGSETTEEGSVHTHTHTHTHTPHHNPDRESAVESENCFSSKIKIK